MTRHENIIQLFAALSVGGLLWQVSLMPTVFYTCRDWDGTVPWAFGLDILSGVACLVQTVVVMLSYTRRGTTDDKKDAKMASYVCFVLGAFNVAAIMWLLLIYGGLVENCPQPPGSDDPNADWENQLSIFHAGSYDKAAGCSSEASTSCKDTLDGPNGFQLLYNPKEWCKLALNRSCPNLVGSGTMERCLRYGAHGFIPVLKYAFALDFVYHASRLLTCVACFLSYREISEGGGASSRSDANANAAPGAGGKTVVSTVEKVAGEKKGIVLRPEEYPFLRHRRSSVQNEHVLNF